MLLHKLVKAAPLQHSVELFIEWMRHRPGQLRVRNPKPFLASLLPSSAHPHARILRTCAVNYTILFLGNPDLHHGLLDFRKTLTPKVKPICTYAQ